MNTKKYRTYLVGLIVAALVCGMFFYLADARGKQIPAEGTLVQRQLETPADDGGVTDGHRGADGTAAWA